MPMTETWEDLMKTLVDLVAQVEKYAATPACRLPDADLADYAQVLHRLEQNVAAIKQHLVRDLARRAVMRLTDRTAAPQAAVLSAGSLSPLGALLNYAAELLTNAVEVSATERQFATTFGR
jgi:dihydroneopterin aldolase